MALTEVDIWNQALGELGSTKLITSEDEASVEARAFNAIYLTAREAMLERHEWRFATKISLALPKIATDNPDPRFDFWYKIPADCIKPREVWDSATTKRPTEPIPFVAFLDDAQGRVFATDLDGPCLVYTKDVTDPAMFSAGFQDVLSVDLAERVALPITKKIAVKQGMLRKLQARMITAMAGEGGIEPPPEDASWIAARGG